MLHFLRNDTTIVSCHFLSVFIFYCLFFLPIENNAQVIPGTWAVTDNNDTILHYDTICIGVSVNLFGVANGMDVVTWEYYIPNALPSYANTKDVSHVRFPNIGTYWIQLNTNSGILNNTFIVVTYCPPSAQISALSKICQNQCMRASQLSSQYATGYQWHFEGGSPEYSSDSLPPEVCYADTGTYSITLIVSNPAGADTARQYITVTAGPSPVSVPSSFIIKEGDELTLEPCAIGSSYQWQAGTAIVENNDTLLTIQPDGSQTYRCTVATPNGCTSTCRYEVSVQSGLLLPTGFSPNADGQNDVFRILNSNITLQRFAIYNRWGQVVYQSADLRTGWDGMYQGIPQPAEVYVWQADYTISKTGKQKTAKGNVTLVR